MDGSLQSANLYIIPTHAYTLIKKHESRNFLLFRESLNLSTAARHEEMAFVGRRWKEARGRNEKARPARCACAYGVSRSN